MFTAFVANFLVQLKVGVNAAKLNRDVLTFFGNDERLYSSFSGSPSR